MADQEIAVEAANNEETPPEEETFTPKGTLFLMVVYVLLFVLAWGSIYFNDLLARR